MFSGLDAHAVTIKYKKHQTYKMVLQYISLYRGSIRLACVRFFYLFSERIFCRAGICRDRKKIQTSTFWRSYKFSHLKDITFCGTKLYL